MGVILVGVASGLLLVFGLPTLGRALGLAAVTDHVSPWTCGVLVLVAPAVSSGTVSDALPLAALAALAVVVVCVAFFRNPRSPEPHFRRRLWPSSPNGTAWPPLESAR